MTNKQTLIYQLTQRGFTSELNNLLLAYLYCLQNDITFRLSSRYWGAAHNKGWTDYFEPFCKEQNNRFTRMGTVTKLPKRIKQRQDIYRIFRPGTLFTHDIWPIIQSSSFTKQNFYLPEFQIDGDIFHTKQKLIKQIFKYNSATKEKIDNLKNRVKPPYIAIHVRRGDKLVSEAKRIEIDSYIAAIQRVPSRSKCVFIATDDFAVIREFQQSCPTYEIFTFCTSDQNGYQQSNFNKATNEQKYSETIQLLTDIECMSKAQHFIGTFSSNIGRFIALRLGLNKCTSLDESWHPL